MIHMNVRDMMSIGSFKCGNRSKMNIRFVTIDLKRLMINKWYVATQFGDDDHHPPIIINSLGALEHILGASHNYCH